jgi:DNA-directed RNA polymerase specialized sigma subunit
MQKKRTKNYLNGVDEDEFLRVIDIITNKLAHKFKFGYHSFDDMKQQASIFAIEALEKYDKSRPLENFLWTHIRNRLFNYKRDNYQRPDKPCLTCPFYDAHRQKSLSQCSQFEDKQNCEPYLGWYNRNNTKKNIMDTMNIDDLNAPSAISNNDTKDIASNNEIIKLLDEKIPAEYRELYLKMKYNAKLTKSEQKTLYEVVSSIISENSYD